MAVVSRNFLFCPRPPGCGYVSTGGGARCSQRLWAAEVGRRWWRQCPQQIGKLGRGNGAAPRAPRRMRCRSRQRAVQGIRPERRCAIDGRLALGVPSVHRRSSPKLVDGQCRQRGRCRGGLVRRFRAPEAWSAVPAFRGLCAATASRLALRDRIERFEQRENAPGLVPGYFAIDWAAVSVSVGAAPAGGVAAAVSLPHATPG